MGARICIFENYLTIRAGLFSREVTIPFREVSSVESGFIHLEVNTKDKRSYTIALKKSDQRNVVELILQKLT